MVAGRHAIPTPGRGEGCGGRRDAARAVPLSGLSLSVIVRVVEPPAAPLNVIRTATVTGRLERFRRARAFAVRATLSVPEPPEGSASLPVPIVTARRPRPRRLAVAASTVAVAENVPARRRGR